MGKTNATRGMTGSSDRKTRGRTSIQKPGVNLGPKSSTPHVPQEMRTEAARPQGPGAGNRRGDRRDMSKLYTNNKKHASRGSNPRADVSTRKR